MEGKDLEKHKRLLALMLTLVFAITIAGCGGSSSSGDKKLTIAMVNPLSGDAATYGVSHKNGVELARAVPTRDPAGGSAAGSAAELEGERTS